MKNTIGIIIGILVAIAVLLTLAVWMMSIGTIRFFDLGSFAIIIILIASALYIIWDRAKNIRKGLPAKDERIILTTYKAGYYGFIAAILTAVGAPLIIDILFNQELEGHLVTAFVVLISGFTFMISYLYVSWKGD
jgi:hypothetical protein